MKKTTLSLLASMLIMSMSTVNASDEIGDVKILETIDVNSNLNAPREDLELSSTTNLYQVENILTL